MTSVQCVPFDQFITALPKMIAGIRVGTVYRIGDGEDAFVLGPEDVCGRVMGLFGEDYGWPVDVPLTSIRTVDDARPGRRRHPVLRDGAQVVAIAILVLEWERIRAD